MTEFDGADDYIDCIVCFKSTGRCMKVEFTVFMGYPAVKFPVALMNSEIRDAYEGKVEWICRENDGTVQVWRR